jgi:hypothetical protein
MAMLGTDVGHWDVTDVAAVLPEVWEQIEAGLLSEAAVARELERVAA